MVSDELLRRWADLTHRLSPLRERLAPIHRRLPLEAIRERAAILVGAILLGLVGLLFAKLADGAQSLFRNVVRSSEWLPFLVTPAMFVAVVWVTRRFFPAAQGSGIPQVIATIDSSRGGIRKSLVSLRVGLAKIGLTLLVLLGGGAAGREGPTVQVSAAIMASVHERFRVRLSSSILIAGGAAGIAAAFNTPLAGIAFAIEELASSYAQKVTIMIMGAVMIAGMVSLGLAGDYVYFGRTSETLGLLQTITIAPVVGIVGGIAGGLFARLLLAHSAGKARWAQLLKARPLVTALSCGLFVAALGYLTDGLSFGTGYHGTRALLAGETVSPLFGPGKLLAALATTFSGAPGGIFAPSLSVGAGLGQLVAMLFPSASMAAVVLLGMTAYFTGVVRAPFTAVIILSEATGNHGAILSMFAAALIADACSAWVCPTRLYHGLARAFLRKSDRPGEQPGPEPAPALPVGNADHSPTEMYDVRQGRDPGDPA
ncbi:chloride channel protein [Sphingomonas sp. ASV193]|uniref:chloride channel protein n=1 Tax=Sphingomonas sp. ASV193 TaxID=3144405 RepID=UPI0032E85297